MRSPFFCGAGGVVSADIAVPEHERELEFYSKVLTTGDSLYWRDDLMNNMGTPIIGLGERTPEYESLPLQWMPHFQVADVARSVEIAVEMGGKEIMHGKSEEGESLWAGLLDPDGAGVGLIPVVADESYSADHSMGRICWLSLNAKDASSSAEFYQRVLGWTSDPSMVSGDSLAHETFQMRADNDRVAAEIRQLSGEKDSFPHVWLMHLPVGDLEESLRLVDELGGSVVEQLSDGSVVVRDPVGVHFALRAGL